MPLSVEYTLRIRVLSCSETLFTPMEFWECNHELLILFFSRHLSFLMSAKAERIYAATVKDCSSFLSDLQFHKLIYILLSKEIRHQG
jgi:hypothetical protein